MSESVSRSLDGRVVLVTGAHGGFGSAVAVACAEAGATVVLLGHKVPRLNRVYDRIAAVGAEPAIYPLDLEGASPDDYAELAERLESGFGGLHGIVHCAAEFRGLTPVVHADPADFARSIHVGLTAPWWLTQAMLPLLAKADDAAVVFTLDSPERVGAAYWGGYGVSQFGLRGAVQILHAELANSRVRVAGLMPGPMRTTLRARAWVEETDRQAVDPSVYAPAAVELLSGAGRSRRGTIWSPTPAELTASPA
ncbi:SDR family NAD(P)-dependent oxidoreductase [Lysobacter sp. TY2-98]|uniref:SDR family NAD(P)-dependent oxidoreductase n=1 Tax=Lysobacter sp. TY2-98 TaxID=2290922 RepID=UPI000E208809|nr:SDR family NAD(P)-dependent oxidoreductase [Lysobacter sp. TY2-98]AXK71478.1 SDR family NAD(P)-dependent oxidoreductase [Lysobacter sp. TY2-98]